MTAQTLPARRSRKTTLDQWVFRIAGIFVLASLALARWHDPHWLWFTAFVGANLLQASFTGFCPLVMILRRLGIKPGAAFEPGLKAQ